MPPTVGRCTEGAQDDTAGRHYSLVKPREALPIQHV